MLDGQTRSRRARNSVLFVDPSNLHPIPTTLIKQVIEAGDCETLLLNVKYFKNDRMCSA